MQKFPHHNLAVVSKVQELYCVVLAPGSWPCWEQSAGIAMPLLWPKLMFPCSTLLLGLLSTPAQQCTVPCGRALGSLAEVILFVPAHAMATVQHPATVIEKEGNYKRMQLEGWFKKVRAWGELRKESETGDSLYGDSTLQEQGTCMGKIQQRNRGQQKCTYAEK